MKQLLTSLLAATRNRRTVFTESLLKSDAIMLSKAAHDGKIGRLLASDKFGFRIDQCGTFDLKAIDAMWRAQQTEKSWID